MYTPKTNPKQKHMETTREHEKGALLLNNSPRGRLTRSGELKASKHCSLLHNCSSWRVDGEQILLSVTHSSLWRADYSPWRVMTGFCREVRFFTPKTQFSSNPIPSLIGNSTYDDSIIWTSIMHNSMDFLHLLTTGFYMFYDQFQFQTLTLKFTRTTTKLQVKFNFRII